MTHAMVDLKAATLRNPRLADAFVSLGSMWVQQQRASSGAMVALDKALELSPNSAVALTLRSGVRMVQGDFPASQLDVTQAMKDAGQLTTAVQARLLDMASLVRGGPAKEVQQALASGANPGMLINRELQNLQQGQLGSMDRPASGHLERHSEYCVIECVGNAIGDCGIHADGPGGYANQNGGIGDEPGIRYAVRHVDRFVAGFPDELHAVSNAESEARLLIAGEQYE
jgi:hypothetical protein